MSLTPKEYVDKVVNKLKFDPSELLKQMTLPKMDLIHMALGIAGEILELEIADPTDIANVREEFGDLLFYVLGAIEASEQEFEYEILSEEDILAKYIKDGGVNAFENIITASEQLLNNIKQHAVLGKDLADLTESARIIIDNTTLVISSLDGTEYTLGDLLQSNHDKLFKRHHTGEFTQETALEKVDHSE